MPTISPLVELFGRYLKERPSGAGVLVVVSRPWFGWREQSLEHDAGRRAVLRALLRCFDLLIAWDELGGLGLGEAQWREAGSGVRELPEHVDLDALFTALGPGGWLIYGSVKGTIPVRLDRAMPAAEAGAAGADVALSASFDSDALELFAKPHAAERLMSELRQRAA